MLFRHGTDTGKRATRAGGASEAQLKELRGKARRRLIGALALVLAAFIVVPWLFDEPVPDDTHAPVVVPATPPGLPPPASTPAPADAAAPSTAPPADNAIGGTLAQNGGQPGGPVTETPAPGSPAAAAQNGQLGAATSPAAPAAPETPAAKPPAPPAAPSTAAKKPGDAEKPAKSGAKSGERTDDGSVALALLAGKAPASSSRGSTAPSSGQGRYYLQVAAYTVEQDAQNRRDSLRQSGVSDAYVERGQSGGRTVYRLRVGPFSSHEAAQAAQARLRALGYQNGLISDK